MKIEALNINLYVKTTILVFFYKQTFHYHKRGQQEEKKTVTSESNSLKENLENYHDYYFGKPEVEKK